MNEDLEPKYYGSSIRTISSSSRATVREKVYCVCKRGASGYMIQCDCCGEWFHGSCVGIREGDNPGVYLCTICCQDDWLACEMLILLSDKQSIQKFVKASKEYFFKRRKLSDTSSSSEGLSEDSPGEEEDAAVEEDDEEPSMEVISDDEDYDEDSVVGISTTTTTTTTRYSTPVSYEDGISPRQSPNDDRKYDKTPPGSPSPTMLSHHHHNNNTYHHSNSLLSSNHKSKKRKNDTQMSILMKYYEDTPDPDLNTKKKIADETSLTVKQVSDWFYNLRVRKKYKISLQ